MVDESLIIITFSVLNSIVVIYAIFLIIYGKFCKKDELFLLVNYNNIINFFQENFCDPKAMPRIEESIRSPDDAYAHVDEKKISLIEVQKFLIFI